MPQKRYSLTGKYTNPFGAVIDYDAPYKTNYALVYCPNFATCGGKQQKVVTRGNQDKQPFFCNTCFIADKRNRMSEAWRAASLKRGGREAVPIEKIIQSVKNTARAIMKEKNTNVKPSLAEIALRLDTTEGALSMSLSPTRGGPGWKKIQTNI